MLGLHYIFSVPYFGLACDHGNSFLFMVFHFVLFCVVDATHLGAWLRSEEGIVWLVAGTIPNSLYRVPFFYLFLACALCLKKNQTTPRPSEHPPVMGGKMSKRSGGIKRLQIQNHYMAFKQVPRCR